MEFTHFDEQGNARMVDVSEKEITHRVAVAEGTICVSREVMDAIKGNKVRKGDVLTVSQVAGIMGTKRTPDLIPMCHPLSLTNASVVFEVDEEACEIKAICRAVTDGKTGVDMEALRALPFKAQIGRAKSVPAEEYKEVYTRLGAELRAQIEHAKQGGEDA